MNSVEYKYYHEARMANHTGTSPLEIEMVLSTASLGIFFAHWLSLNDSFKCGYLSFFLDFLFIVLPIACEVTIMSNMTCMIPLNMFLIFLIILKRVGMSDVKEVLNSKVSKKKTYITNYRSSTNLVSALCILAVDFSLFPRRFAKTELFGFGLMDVGVGYFICSNGIVAKNMTTKPEFFKVMRSTSVLILLGFIRLFSVKNTNYHEHVSEYGVHWNFFFTLGFCKLLSYLILCKSKIKSPFYLAIFVGLIHQILLFNGMEQWVISDKQRETFLSANREGLASLLGYVSLYFASVSLGEIVNPVVSQITFKKLLLYLSTLCVIMWFLTGICYLTMGISRRLTNIGYSFWIIASTLSVLIQLIIIDVVIPSIYRCKEKRPIVLKQSVLLLECINSNGLFFFLFSNILTGVINISFQTLLLDAFSGFIIIMMYMLILCGVTWLLYYKNWILKF